MEDHETEMEDVHSPLRLPPPAQCSSAIDNNSSSDYPVLGASTIHSYGNQQDAQA